MLLMRWMMTKVMLTNIFGEPNDYTLEKFGKADGKNGDDWVDENDNKGDSKDDTQDKVETFNEDTCNVCAYDFWTL